MAVSSEEFDVDAADDVYLYKNSDHASGILEGLDLLRKDAAFCDVTLCVNGENLNAHKAVLAAFSPYFKAMFTSNLAESRQEHVTLNGVDEEMVSLLLDYAYSSSIRITKNNVQSLLSASNLLEVSSVRNSCCNFLEKQIEVSNCVGIHCFADTHSCTELANKAKDYILKNFTEVYTHEEWLKLPVEKVVEILKSDKLCVSKEEKVYAAASRWMNSNPGSRGPGFHKVLECVRLPLVSPYFLIDVVEAEKPVRSSPECRLLIEEARLYHLLPDRRHDIKSPRIAPRENANTSMVIVAVGGEDSKIVLRSVECYDPISHNWRSLSCLPFAVSKHGLVVSGDNVLYLAGGEFPDGSVTRCLWKYDHGLDEWHDLAPMKTPRAELGLAILDGLLYAVGGWNGSSRLSSVEVYDPALNRWDPVPPMHVAVTSPAVASYQGGLFVCGGAILENGDGIDQAQMFNPHRNEWFQLPSMIIPRSGSSAAVVNGCVYVIGGWHASTENTNKVERYSIASKKWTLVASMKEKRYRAGVSVVFGKIYILGGEDGWEQFHDTIESYDPDLDRWSVAGEMLTGRSWLACAPLRIRKDLMGELTTVQL